MSTPKIVVTGCAGYIGSVLVGHLLKSGCRVVGIDSLLFHNGPALFNYLGNPNFEFHRMDVRNPEIEGLYAKADGIIPLAALVGAPLCQSNHAEAREVNFEAIAKLCRTASKQQRIIYPNTNSGYGQTDGESEVTENDPLNPISVYGKTKCDAEKAVLDHPNSVVLRLATVFGASPRMRMDLMVNDFVRRIYDTIWAPALLQIYEPHFKRNFVGVQDVARAFSFMLPRQQLRGVFNLGLPSANLTKIELAYRICDVLGVSREGVSVGKGKDPDQRNYIVSNAKILSTGFSFVHELDRGIREVAKVCGMSSTEQMMEMSNV